MDRGWSLRSTPGDPLGPPWGRLWRGRRGSRRLAAQGASRSPSPAQRAGKDRPRPVPAQRANNSSRPPQGSWNDWPVGPDGVSPRYQGLRAWLRDTGDQPLFMNPHQMPQHVLSQRFTMTLENWPRSLQLTTPPVTTATRQPLIAEGHGQRYPTSGRLGSRAERGLWS
jgi:hypothetical protein